MTVQAETKIIMKEKHKRRSDTDLVYGPNKDVSFKNRLKKPFKKNRGKSCSDDVPVTAVVVSNGNRNSLLSFMFCSFSGSSRRPRANEFTVDLDEDEENFPYMKKDVGAESGNTAIVPVQVEEKQNTEPELNNNTTKVVPDEHTECQQKHECENKKNTESQAVQSPVAPIISSYNKKTHNFLMKLMNLKNAFIKAKVSAQLNSNTSSSSYGGGKPCTKDHTISTKGKTCVYNIEQTRDRSSLIISMKNNDKRSSIVISLQDLTARKNSSHKPPMENRNRSDSTSSSICFSGIGDDEMDLSYLIEFANQAFDHQVYNFENSADGPDGEEDTGDYPENSFIDCKDDDEPAEWVDGPSCVEENDKSFEMLSDQEALNSLHEAIAKFEDSGLENSQNDFNEFEESLLFNGHTEDIMTFNEDDIRVVFQRAPHVLSGIDRDSMCESLHLADGDDDDIIIANGPDLGL